MPNRAAIVRLIAYFGLAMVWAAMTGRLQVHLVNDSPSYINYPFDSLAESLLSIRPPVYPLFLKVVSLSVGLAAVPFLQLVLHTLASAFLGDELIARGLSVKSSMSVAITVLLGCTFNDNINTISTDAPAASMAVLVVAFLLRTYRSGTTSSAVGCIAAAILCIFARPAYLFLIPWIAVAGWLLHRGDRERDLKLPSHRFRGGLISICVGAAVLCWMLTRLVFVNDFAILPFGHQNLSAVLAQLVTPDDMRSLSAEAEPRTAELLAEIASDLESRDFVLPTSELKTIPTLTLETQWGQINYGVIWPAAKRVQASIPVESTDVDARIQTHRLIGNFNRVILRSSPISYLKWIALAGRRAVWGSMANVAMHPLFLIGIVGVCGWLIWIAASGQSVGQFVISDGWYGFAMIAISYFAFKVGFIILTSPPIGRFADAAAILLPGLATSFMFARTPTRPTEASS
ncbi:hypothetical protein LOC67_14955 [Stieleria sp. JC731]|uniref:hypothetical protein n=1 Tax=Pirellulaceae TaxID=2691357 RepID=UPI001E430D98|nr:hypothetical protein [Stieleria sp. JC731]MCC9601858.1 hypothetical protein [Stieleria sp. JC731]